MIFPPPSNSHVTLSHHKNNSYSGISKEKDGTRPFSFFFKKNMFISLFECLIGKEIPNSFESLLLR